MQWENRYLSILNGMLPVAVKPVSLWIKKNKNNMSRRHFFRYSCYICTLNWRRMTPSLHSYPSIKEKADIYRGKSVVPPTVLHTFFFSHIARNKFVEDFNAYFRPVARNSKGRYRLYSIADKNNQKETEECALLTGLWWVPEGLTYPPVSPV